MNSPATQRVGVKWFEAALWLAALLLLSLGTVRLTGQRTPPEAELPQGSENLVYAYDVRDIADAIVAQSNPRYPGATDPLPPNWDGIIFTSPSPGPAAPPPSPEAVATTRIGEIIESICSANEWVDAGGTRATMQVVPGWLIVSDTGQGHAEIRRFLQVLRQTKDARQSGARPWR